MTPLDARTRAVLASRYLAGDTIRVLAEDYGAFCPVSLDERYEMAGAVLSGLAERVREAEGEIETLRVLLYVICERWEQGSNLCPACGQYPCEPDCRLAAALEGEG